uniref:tRNA-dihydrouridine(47) synthase [NAD(P)(+)] n=2 Tax=Ascaris TaxID=6251 RepID=A0A9J2PXF8_ASCLU
MLHFEELNRCGENGMDVVTEPPVDEIVGETVKKTRMGYAPIKKEYLIEGKTTIDPSSADDSDVVGRPKKANENESGKKIKRRGVNRERGKKMAKARAEVRERHTRLCASMVTNKPCKYGDKCTSLHSIDKYLAIKPADLGPSCYIFQQRGQCPFSYACRFAKSHTNDDLTQKIKLPSKGYLKTLNAETIILQKALRKKEYDFSKCEKVIMNLPQMIGCMEREKFTLNMADLAGKTYLAPLTTVGNLPFRRLCVDLGAEITCSEMGVCTSLLSGSPSEWSLLKRHQSEKIFGVQLAGGFPDTMSRAAQIISENMDVDFIDVNCGCPLELINEKGGGCTLASRSNKLEEVMKAMSAVMGGLPLTLKLRTGLKENIYTAHQTIAKIVSTCPPQLITLHPRSKEQRYTKLADWEYTRECSLAAAKVPFWACGDILSYHDYYKRLEEYPINGVMIARGALIKPWIFTEIKERRDWDISARERLEFVQRFVNYGLDHWGSDDAGIEKTRSFLLEWLSFAYRYIPVGLLEVIPQRINERPPAFRGRNELETLMSSDHSQDWVKISEMFLGKVPDGFLFMPKHNANAYGADCTVEG